MKLSSVASMTRPLLPVLPVLPVLPRSRCWCLPVTHSIKISIFTLTVNHDLESAFTSTTTTTSDLIRFFVRYRSILSEKKASKLFMFCFFCFTFICWESFYLSRNLSNRMVSSLWAQLSTVSLGCERGFVTQDKTSSTQVFDQLFWSDRFKKTT